MPAAGRLAWLCRRSLPSCLPAGPASFARQSHAACVRLHRRRRPPHRRAISRHVRPPSHWRASSASSSGDHSVYVPVRISIPQVCSLRNGWLCDSAGANPPAALQAGTAECLQLAAGLSSGVPEDVDRDLANLRRRPRIAERCGREVRLLAATGAVLRWSISPGFCSAIEADPAMDHSYPSKPRPADDLHDAMFCRYHSSRRTKKKSVAPGCKSASREATCSSKSTTSTGQPSNSQTLRRKAGMSEYDVSFRATARRRGIPPHRETSLSDL